MVCDLQPSGRRGEAILTPIPRPDGWNRARHARLCGLMIGWNRLGSDLENLERLAFGIWDSGIWEL